MPSDATLMASISASELPQRRAKAAGIDTRVGNHTFRTTGVSAYLTNGGMLEKAAKMGRVGRREAAHFGT